MAKSQLNFLIPGAIGKPQMVDPELVAQCPTKKEAIRLCIHLSGLTQKVVCERLGIDPGHFSRIMSGKGHFPDDKYPDLYSVCRNYAPLQWEAMKCGFTLGSNNHRRASDFGGRRQSSEARYSA